MDSGTFAGCTRSTKPHDLNRPTTFSTVKDYLSYRPRTPRQMADEVHQVAFNLQVWKAGRSNERIYISSDGGLSGTEGTFIWVIVTKYRTPFDCEGPVDGAILFNTLIASWLCIITTPNSKYNTTLGTEASVLFLMNHWQQTCHFNSKEDNQKGSQSYPPTIRCRHTRNDDLFVELRRSVVFAWVKKTPRQLESIWSTLASSKFKCFGWLSCHQISSSRQTQVLTALGSPPVFANVHLFQWISTHKPVRQMSAIPHQRVPSPPLHPSKK